MRAQQAGDGYVVEVDAGEVAAFAASWPSSNLNADAGKEFHFDGRNGDLVDLFSIVDGRRTSTEAEDGPALAALSEDAGLFGARELGLDDVVAIRAPSPGPRI